MMDIDQEHPIQPEKSGHNLTMLTYKAISEMIRDRRLQGGHVIVEARLAETLGISRTPLREALQRLEGEGLVLKGEGRNYIVRKVDIGEYLQSLRLRLLIEPEAAALAIPLITRRLLISVREEIDALMGATAYHTDSHWFSDDRLQPDSTEHLEIVAAIEAGDEDATRKATTAHIESLIAFARRNLASGA